MPNREVAGNAVGDEAARKGLELQFFVSGELPAALLGDSLRLRQVLLNFLTNAIKYTERGAVTVLVEPDERPGPGIGVRFTVNDTGVGLTAAERERVFRREPELSASGAGLGLCIAGRLVEMLGGEAGVESRVTNAVFLFGGLDDSLLLEGTGWYPGEGATLEVSATLVRAIIGGTGMYAGASGYVESTRNADDTWTHVFSFD